MSSINSPAYQRDVFKMPAQRMVKAANKPEGRDTVLTVKKSMNLVKNNELKRAQLKYKQLPVIMQVGEPVLTENYVPRVPTVTKNGSLVATKRFFERGLLRLAENDSLDDIVYLEDARDLLVEAAIHDIFKGEIIKKLQEDPSSKTVMHTNVVQAILLAKGVNLCCHHLRSHQNQQGGLRHYYANQNQLLTYDNRSLAAVGVYFIKTFHREQEQSDSAASVGLQ